MSFLWGVSSAGYQCEGGYNGPGEPRNNWGDAEDSGRVARTGLATDFWNRYEEDFGHARAMGLNAFRLSIEWTRVQPSTSAEETAPPPFDEAALRGYALRIAKCREYGLEPVITLHHFTHPAWLGLDAWLRDDTPALFATFVGYAIRTINDILSKDHGQEPLEWFITLNEPNMLVVNTYLHRHFPGKMRSGFDIGVQAYNRLLAAHVRAYNVIHDLYEERDWATPQVTMNTFCSDVYWSEKLLLDLLCSREKGISRLELKNYLHESAAHLHRALMEEKLLFRRDMYIWLGRLFHWWVDHFAPRHAVSETFAYFLDTLEASKRPRVLDYLGVDYYDPFTSHLFRPPSFADLEFKSSSIYGRLMDSLASKWWDWHALPEGLYFFCRYYTEEYQRPLLIAENGMALRKKFDNSVAVARKDKLTRSEFLTAHVQQVRRLVADGVPVLGYMHWSITDNYEWGSYTARFGLISIDFMDNAKRLNTDHLGDRPTETYRKLVAEAREAEPATPV